MRITDAETKRSEPVKTYMRLILTAGIFLLIGGGYARFTGSGAAPFLFSAGGSCKIAYVIIAVKKGVYRPGYEIMFLFSGLVLLAAGIITRHISQESLYASSLIASAIALKLVFVLSFIKKVRAAAV